MNSSAICKDDQRREAVRRKAGLNGLDYLEVSPDQMTLNVYFLGKAPDQFQKQATESPEDHEWRLRGYFRIEGGRRIRDIRVTKVEVMRVDRDDEDDYLILRLNKPGDFSTYNLHVVEANQPSDIPRLNFDPRYAQLDFTFKVDCPSDMDCAPVDICPPSKLDEPNINYLAKDYASFRQLILDRLALIMPDWEERHVPDLDITLVELLAYVGDQLSYYQDAVATEAYLDTARQRISVRRHARLVDYHMHEGCNARAWVCIETDSDLTGNSALDPHSIFFITNFNDALTMESMLTAEDLQNISTQQYEAFEPMTIQPIPLYKAHNEIHFYTWDMRECCLPRGATSATLQDVYAPSGIELVSLKVAVAPVPDSERKRQLHLQAGDVLIFEEMRGPKTGVEEDADPSHRHAVRLIKVTEGEDTLHDPPIPILEIEWSQEDTLPFPLCISAITDADHGCKYIGDISVARGNVILVDHGRTLETPEDLDIVPYRPALAECDCEEHPTEVAFMPGIFQPRLLKTPLTYRVPFPQPGVIARQQARLLAMLMSRVQDRLIVLWQKTRAGKTLTTQELDELDYLFGNKAMREAEQRYPDGKAWRDMDSSRQAVEIKRLLGEKDKWLGHKARRVATLQARAQTGQVLNDAASEITELFGAQYAEGLTPDSPDMLGPASATLLQDARLALPQIALTSILAMRDENYRVIEWAALTDQETLVEALTAAGFNAHNYPHGISLSLVLYAGYQEAQRKCAEAARAMQEHPDQEELKDTYQKTVARSDEARRSLVDDLVQRWACWIPQNDLLDSGPDDRHFVVEIDNNGYAHLRFGNGELGSLPEAGSGFFATYRVGNGITGNVGAETISCTVFRESLLSGVQLRVRNPLPAQSGTEPEPMSEVKLFAPFAFRRELQRAITADDYARVMTSQSEIKDQLQGAAAALTWNGSWYEAQVAVDPFSSEETNQQFLNAVQDRLYRYRRIGHDLSVAPAQYVPLDIEMTVCVRSGYLRGHIEAALLDAFSSRVLPDGRLGFFHPDNLGFGGGIYLSQLVATAQAVTGVESVTVKKLQRLYEGDHGELDDGVLRLGPLEVARLDNDPSFPEHGRLKLDVRGER
ncbi:MAG TPA: putative baseplate assembly protein [Anaerolineales bacterium]|nr:putative baseplate assembly protein [Anaerolineales bacterium]